MMKRLTAVAVTGLLALMLTACGDNNAPKPVATPDNSAAQPMQQPDQSQPQPSDEQH